MSKVTLMFEGENAADLCQQVCDYVAHYKHDDTAAVAPTPTKEAPKSTKEASEKPPAAKAAKPKVAPAPKAEEPEEEATEEDDEGSPFDTGTDEEEGEPEGEELTLQIVEAELTKVGEEKGIPAVKAILAKFKIKKVKDLKENQFAEVMKAAKKALA